MTPDYLKGYPATKLFVLLEKKGDDEEIAPVSRIYTPRKPSNRTTAEVTVYNKRTKATSTKSVYRSTKGAYIKSKSSGRAYLNDFSKPCDAK